MISGSSIKKPITAVARRVARWTGAARVWKMTTRVGKRWNGFRTGLGRRVEPIRSFVSDHWIVIVLLVVIPAAAVALIWLPVWQAGGIDLAADPGSVVTADQRRAELENDFRVTVAQVIAGTALLFGLYATWRRVSAAERTVEVAEQGQITERFTRAIEQLGAVHSDGLRPNIEVRLGGIYALERIARDSERDFWPIMEVLTAYVRENAPFRRPSADAGTAAEGQAGTVAEAGQEAAASGRPAAASPAVNNEKPRPRTDIQTVLTVLGRRSVEYQRQGEQLDLSGTDLRGARLSGIHFDRNGKEQQFNLAGANLSGASLNGAYLIRASLNGAILSGASLNGAELTHASLNGAYLWDASLNEASLSEASLDGAYLSGASLDGAYLRGASLDEADLSGASLNGAELSHAWLDGANLFRASLDEADLSGASLVGANLSGAKLSTARNVTQAQIDSANGDSDTELPDHITRPAHWT